ncbi:hypothetical protein [Psychrobacter sp. I-STPA10]|uniref:hypothetical protein n=1 Tax=Psychrobacter sp. I-STPA10 TaxID=2585769 RepID=UPI001E32D768|nr:hypothetical protein [Psychrobacter sp. I-STPA10]
MTKHEFSYIGADYFSLILRIAANYACPAPYADWTILAIGQLIHQSDIFIIFDYDDMRFLDTDFITTDYQWLFVYQQLARACHVIQNMPAIIDFSTWHYLNAGEWGNAIDTTKLKKAAKLLLKDFVSIANFPDLHAEWLLFFRILHENKYDYEINQALPYPSTFMMTHNKYCLVDDKGNQVDWYDIFHVSISHDAYQLVSHLTKLHFSLGCKNVMVRSIDSENFM